MFTCYNGWHKASEIRVKKIRLTRNILLEVSQQNKSKVSIKYMMIMNCNLTHSKASIPNGSLKLKNMWLGLFWNGWPSSDTIYSVDIVTAFPNQIVLHASILHLKWMSRPNEKFDCRDLLSSLGTQWLRVYGIASKYRYEGWPARIINYFREQPL